VFAHGQRFSVFGCSTFTIAHQVQLVLCGEQNIKCLHHGITNSKKYECFYLYNRPTYLELQQTVRQFENFSLLK